MKEVGLTRGYIAIVDDSDFESVSRYRWHVVFSHGTPYAARRGRRGDVRRVTLMQNQIMPPPPGLENDHKNRNSLDNRRENLRTCTHAENCRNRRHRKSLSGFKGVQMQNGHYAVKIYVGGKQLYIGTFSDAVEAARAYDVAAKKHFGEFAKINGA